MCLAFFLTHLNQKLTIVIAILPPPWTQRIRKAMRLAQVYTTKEWQGCDSNHTSAIIPPCFSISESESVSRSIMSYSLWPHGLYTTRLLCPWDSPGKNTGMGNHSLLQGIFPTQGSNPGLSCCRQILYCLSHQGSSPVWQLKLFLWYVLWYF